jgi:hypothetical protein
MQKNEKSHYTVPSKFKNALYWRFSCLVAHAIGIEEGNEDIGDSALDVPEEVLVLAGVYQPRHDLALQNQPFFNSVGFFANPNLGRIWPDSQPEMDFLNSIF